MLIIAQHAISTLRRSRNSPVGEWIERHENLLVIGPTGTGKRRSVTRGHHACRDNHRVRPAGDGRYARMPKSLAHVQVLIFDDWGDTLLTAEQRCDLLEIVDKRHGRATVAHWHEYIGKPTIAAVLDRPVHTAHRVECRGESFRNCAP
jgi:DNA replication protein DnaC